ncbi:SMI1/KNR4 family protein [Cryptosporangium japonicum]|uniref:SMI1/KNR4 family protein n=1 Tax=Cryptosporangium japonicum TaxID=80872 RepID=UPI003CD09823
MTAEQLSQVFRDLNLDEFWEDSACADEAYGGGCPTDELVASVEEELGFRLPASYVALMRTRNGGRPRNTCCPAPSRTTWADDHVAVTAILRLRLSAGPGRRLGRVTCSARPVCGLWHEGPLVTRRNVQRS